MGESKTENTERVEREETTTRTAPQQPEPGVMTDQTTETRVQETNVVEEKDEEK